MSEQPEPLHRTAARLVEATQRLTDAVATYPRFATDTDFEAVLELHGTVVGLARAAGLELPPPLQTAGLPVYRVDYLLDGTPSYMPIDPGSISARNAWQVQLRHLLAAARAMAGEQGEGGNAGLARSRPRHGDEPRRKKRGGRPPLKESDGLYKVYERIRQVHQPGGAYADTVARLKGDKDFLEQLKEAALQKPDSKLVRRALAFFSQAHRAEARKKQETDSA